MNRRQFFAALLFLRRPALRLEGIQIRVIEIFRSHSGPSALLVHHANESQRGQFSQWLHSRDGSYIQLTLPEGQAITGQIFRMRLCFGRGLIFLEKSARIKVMEVLTTKGE